MKNKNIMKFSKMENFQKQSYHSQLEVVNFLYSSFETLFTVFETTFNLPLTTGFQLDCAIIFKFFLKFCNQNCWIFSHVFQSELYFRYFLNIFIWVFFFNIFRFINLGGQFVIGQKVLVFLRIDLQLKNNTWLFIFFLEREFLSKFAHEDF